MGFKVVFGKCFLEEQEQRRGVSQRTGGEIAMTLMTTVANHMMLILPTLGVVGGAGGAKDVRAL